MAMRIGLPLFGTEISPRFCFAREMMVVTLTDGPSAAELGRERVSLEGMSWPQRLAVLAALRIDTLLCGGFPRDLLPRANAQGLRVCVGLSGEAEDVLGAFRRNALEDVTIGRKRPHAARRRRRVANGNRGA
jgi:hypothetical protein